MMYLALFRHVHSQWNAVGRIQGRTDIGLSPDGRAKMAGLRLPDEMEKWRAFTSPLQRARQTAALLGLAGARLDGRLAEHHWGRWEGLTRAEILARDGADAFERAGTGKAFHPPGGESVRALMDRVQSFFAAMAADPADSVAITHRGIMRTAYALATGWAMTTPMPAQLDLTAILVLVIDRQGNAAIAALNKPLIARTAEAPRNHPTA
jgi:probable phosphoglycerate mutase